MIAKCAYVSFVLVIATSFVSGTAEAAPDLHIAKNVISITTGTVPDQNDPRIVQVANQLDRIQGYCAVTSHGANTGDKIAYSHSLLNVRQSIFLMLDGFEKIAQRQCRSIDNGMLLGLYVLERNNGASHAETVQRI